MLVFCNGAKKSGSTWLYNIVRSAVPHEPIPRRWQRDDRVSPQVKRQKLETSIDRHKGRHLHKGHIVPAPPSMRERDDVFVLNISRDIRGAVASLFHHREANGADESLAAFWDEAGRPFAAELREFHAYWDVPSPRYHRFSYEGLLKDFEGEIERARPLLESAGGTVDPQAIRQATTLQALAKRHTRDTGRDMAWFFRKGEAEDWRNHLTGEIAQEAVEIAGAYAFAREPSETP